VVRLPRPSRAAPSRHPETGYPDQPDCDIRSLVITAPVSDTTAGSTSLRDDCRLVKSLSCRPLAEIRQLLRTLGWVEDATLIATSLEEAIPKFGEFIFRQASPLRYVLSHLEVVADGGSHLYVA
jgi:hypothetical protein